MQQVPQGAPFDERGGRLRGVIDLVAGRYPSFLFGFPVGAILPIFHFHETTAAELEPALAYLRDNGYRTVGADELGRFVREGHHPGPKTVVLTFDDAWASLWIVAGPLLEAYGMRAVVYVIPGRTREAEGVRPTSKQGAVNAEAADRSAQPLCTWPEVRALASSGHFDVQTHTQSHAMIFTGPPAIGVVDPDFRRETFLNRARVQTPAGPVLLDPSRLGHPMFPARARMSAAHEFTPDAASCAAMEDYVRERGGEAFFARPAWREELAPMLASIAGTTETDAVRVHAIERELAESRETIEARIGVPVRHVCLPWGVTSETTYAALERLGFSTAVANRLEGRLAAAHGDDPFYIKRLHSRHLFALPGRGRKVFVTLRG